MDISASYHTHVMMKDVTKISSWWVKVQQVGGESKSWGFLLVLFFSFFIFP